MSTLLSMNLRLSNFQWHRCLGGYRLTSGGRGLESVGKRFEWYRPFEVPSLFLTFADTQATAEGMLDFCNRWGLLGSVRPERQHRPTFESVGTDALLSFQRPMRRAVDAYQQGDVSILRRAFHAEGQWNSIGVELHEDNGGLVLLAEPPDLIRALWLQFCCAACNGAKIFACERCHSRFVVGTGTGQRNTKKYCSNACKVAAFKAHKKKAATAAGIKHRA